MSKCEQLSSINYSQSKQTIQNRNVLVLKIQIDKNFFLKINSQLKGLQIIIKGTIHHKNGMQLNFRQAYWNIIYSNANLEIDMQLCLFDWQYQRILFLSKIKLIKPNFQHFQKITNQKRTKIVHNAQSLIEKCYSTGLLNFSNRFNFSVSLDEAGLKRRLILKTKLENQKDYLTHQKTIDEFSPIIDEINQDQIVIKTAAIQVVQVPLKSEDVPEGLHWGYKNIKMNFENSIDKLVKEGGFFKIQKFVCKLLLINNNQNLQKTCKLGKTQCQIFYQKSIDKTDTSKTHGSTIFAEKQWKFDLLVRKTLKDQKKDNFLNHLKLTKQLYIIKKIKRKQHLINYYQNTEKDQKDQITNLRSSLDSLQASQKITSSQSWNKLKKQEIKILFKHQVFMEFHPYTLNTFIFKKHINYQQRLNLCFQIIQSVLFLHQSQIIHRDLKPDNFLIDFSSNKTKVIVKIIDFGQASIHIDPKHQIQEKFKLNQEQKLIRQNIFEKHNPRLYGFTFPYSPLQCQCNRLNRQSIGVNNFKIDAWSIGLILLFVTKGKQAINIFKVYEEDMVKFMTQSGIQFSVSRSQKRGYRLLQALSHYVLIKCVVMSQEKRLMVKQIYQMFQELKEYIGSLKYRFVRKKKLKCNNQKQIRVLSK